MSCKLTPWGAAAAVRNLSVRTRRPQTAAIQRISRSKQIPTHHTPFLITKRGLSDDINSRPPPDDYPDLPPPPPQEPTLSSSEPAAPGEYVPQPPEIFAPNFYNIEAINALEKASEGEDIFTEEEIEGLSFGMPDKVGKDEKLQSRYHPVIDQITKLLMRDGKLSKAQRHMGLILNYLRTAPPPKISPLRPLLPGSPPASQLPLNPLLYLTLAVDSVAPLIRIRGIKGAAGGGHALEVPDPLAARPRRRVAVMWILDIVRKKRGSGSGRAQFATRFAQEIVAVVEGRSAVWQKRDQLHKLGTASRANLNHFAVKK